MGSDDIHHKRKAKKSFSRKKPSRKSYDSVLIVCEGEKTEPEYFKKIKNYFRLSTLTTIDIKGEECGSAPINVVDYGLKEYKNLKYDKIFCVFDKDSHRTYSKALDKIKNTKVKKGCEIQAIYSSVPCFELWLLLHFTYTTRQFSATEKMSICDSVADFIKKSLYIPNYNKTTYEPSDDLMKKIDYAIENGRKLEMHNKKTGTDMPSTNVHKLVEYLKNLKGHP